MNFPGRGQMYKDGGGAFRHQVEGGGAVVATARTGRAGQQLLQSGFSLLQLAELPHVINDHAAEALGPCVDRLLTDAVTLGHLGHRIAGSFL